MCLNFEIFFNCSLWRTLLTILIIAVCLFSEFKVDIYYRNFLWKIKWDLYIKLNNYLIQAMKPKPQSQKMNQNHLQVEQSTESDGHPSTTSSYVARPPPPTTANRSAQSRKNFRETWSSIAPSLKVISPDEVYDQVWKRLQKTLPTLVKRQDGVPCSSFRMILK